MAKANRPRGAVDVGLRVEACISDHDEAAFDVMRRRVTSRVLAQYPHWEYLDVIGITLPKAFVDIARRSEAGAASSEAATLMPRHVVESMVLAGNAESCARQLARGLRPAITHVTLRPHAAFGEDVSVVIRTFIERVVPRAIELTARAGE